jgi:hypothetical protein
MCMYHRRAGAVVVDDVHPRALVACNMFTVISDKNNKVYVSIFIVYLFYQHIATSDRVYIYAYMQM